MKSSLRQAEPARLPPAMASCGPPPPACWQPATLVAGQRIPQINLAYLFRGIVCTTPNGQIASGFVSRPGGVNWQPALAYLDEVTRRPNAQGLYEGRVVLRQSAVKVSTFFPDAWGSNDLIVRIQGAYADLLSRQRPHTPWSAVTVDGILIKGTLDSCGRIATVDPVLPQR